MFRVAPVLATMGSQLACLDTFGRLSRYCPSLNYQLISSTELAVPAVFSRAAAGIVGSTYVFLVAFSTFD